MVTIETISIVFTGLSVSLAAFYYIARASPSRWLKNQKPILTLAARAVIIKVKDLYA